MDFAIPADHWVKLEEGEMKDKFLDLTRELKKKKKKQTMKQESGDDTSCNWPTRHSHQRIDTETRGLGNKSTKRDHPNYSIVEIGQNADVKKVFKE